MITSVTFPDDVTRSVGLQACDLRDLGQVVVLAGPNGGGKSRFLRLLQSECECLIAPQRAADMRRTIGVAFAGQQRIPVLLEPAGVSIRTPSIDLPDPSKPADTVFVKLAGTRWQRLDETARALFNASHPALAADENARTAGKHARQLNRLIDALIGGTVEFELQNAAPVARMFGRRYRETELSAGQHLLLVWALLLREHGAELKRGSVLLIDEPERQLHPQAAVALLNRLRRRVGSDGQIWIATHSPAIVAAVGGNSVYVVNESKISFAGTRVDHVLNSLLGGTAARRALQDALANADQLALHRYAVESLFAPTVAHHRTGDQQETQFSVLAAARVRSGESKLRILDYGAGKARFASALVELPREKRERVDYYAFNDSSHDDYHRECVENVCRLHPGEIHREVHDTSAFYGANQVNVVLMSNFLHEIEPQQWGNHFAEVARVLTDDGVLVVMEDQEPPIGELPTLHGAIVLDLREVRILFGETTKVQSLSSHERLSMIEIPKAALAGFSGSTLKAAVRAANGRAKSRLRQIRSGSAGASPASPQAAGRRHAFYAMLCASTQLVLDDLMEPVT